MKSKVFGFVPYQADATIGDGDKPNSVVFRVGVPEGLPVPVVHRLVNPHPHGLSGGLCGLGSFLEESAEARRGSSVGLGGEGCGGSGRGCRLVEAAHEVAAGGGGALHPTLLSLLSFSLLFECLVGGVEQQPDAGAHGEYERAEHPVEEHEEHAPPAPFDQRVVVVVLQACLLDAVVDGLQRPDEDEDEEGGVIRGVVPLRNDLGEPDDALPKVNHYDKSQALHQVLNIERDRHCVPQLRDRDLHDGVEDQHEGDDDIEPGVVVHLPSDDADRDEAEVPDHVEDAVVEWGGAPLLHISLVREQPKDAGVEEARGQEEGGVLFIDRVDGDLHARDANEVAELEDSPHQPLDRKARAVHRHAEPRMEEETEE
mmetsp:Transcript_11409/g.36051  ORF Transcript_11409/g.36051 Transcript_11409/m.36051 type:complete len:370 (+) Transcript_11409:201-1310(+)